MQYYISPSLNFRRKGTINDFILCKVINDYNCCYTFVPVKKISFCETIDILDFNLYSNFENLSNRILVEIEILLYWNMFCKDTI